MRVEDEHAREWYAKETIEQNWSSRALERQVSRLYYERLLSSKFAWAGNAGAPGGFHRIRRSEKPAQLPLAIHAAKGALTVTFSEPLDPASVKPEHFALKVWSLKRSAGYGSGHVGERPLPISAAKLGSDSRTVTLAIPELAPTQCYELKMGDRVLHGTIHALAEK